MRELPGAMFARVHAPRRSVTAAALLAVVAVAVAAASMPLAMSGHPASPTPSAAIAHGSTAGTTPPSPLSPSPALAAGDRTAVAIASLEPAHASDAPVEPAAPPPTATPSCGPGTYLDCSAIPVPSALPAVDQGPIPFTLHVPILEFHRVKPADGETGYSSSLVVPPEIFAAQMEALAADGWQTITMGQLGDDLRSRIQPPNKSFVVTLDDGYEDGYTNAYPILSGLGFVATYFVIGSRIGAPGQMTASELATLVATGNEIGNHSMSHTDLRIRTADQLVTETLGTSAVIARDTGVWPQSFAFPIGLTDPAVTQAVAACPGIETAVIQGGSKRETWSNRFELPRIRVGPGTYPQDLVTRMHWMLP